MLRAAQALTLPPKRGVRYLDLFSAYGPLMPCIPSARDKTILYPMGTTTMDTLRKLEFSKRQTSLFYMKWPYKEKLRGAILVI